MRRHNMSIVEEGILRSHIRMMIREAEVPRSEIINLRPGSSEKPIGTPGATALKIVGVLLATSWLSSYVSADCMAGVSNLGMPIPNAYAKYLLYKGASTPGASAAVSSGAPDAKKNLVVDWSTGLLEDINGDSKADDPYHAGGGLVGLFRLIRSNVNGGNPGSSIWPKDAGEIQQIQGNNAAMFDFNNPKTQFENLTVFVAEILNRQCKGAIRNERAAQLINEKFKKREDFIAFIKTYNQTMYKDFTSMVADHKKTFAEDKFSPAASAESAIKTAAAEYTSADKAIY
jgi:hypothetical protein